MFIVAYLIHSDFNPKNSVSTNGMKNPHCCIMTTDHCHSNNTTFKKSLKISFVIFILYCIFTLSCYFWQVKYV